MYVCSTAMAMVSRLVSSSLRPLHSSRQVRTWKERMIHCKGKPSAAVRCEACCKHLQHRVSPRIGCAEVCRPLTPHRDAACEQRMLSSKEAHRRSIATRRCRYLLLNRARVAAYALPSCSRLKKMPVLTSLRLRLFSARQQSAQGVSPDSASAADTGHERCQEQLS